MKVVIIMSFAPDPKPNSVYIHLDDPHYFSNLTGVLDEYFSTLLPQHNHQIVVLCIGTDRATGDSLGPLIGYKLNSMRFPQAVVRGTLDEPVHAKNLVATLEQLNSSHPHALILAIDACLGSLENVGAVSIGHGGIKPGAGVKKDLPYVGDFHITGIVNFSSLMNMAVLQSTRLSTVMSMADAIAASIRYSLWNYYKAH